MQVQVSDRPRKHSDQVAEWLLELGYTHCFFVAGGNIMHLLDAMRSRMTCIPVVHEVSAGIAAEYFNEVSNHAKAFALVTAGPGVTNILTAMSGAWLESRELLVIAGQVKSEDLSRGFVRQRGIQEIDGVVLARPISKLAISVERPMDHATFVQTVSEGWNGRPGPIFIEYCLDAQGASPIEDNFHQSDVVEVDDYATVSVAARDIESRLLRASRPVVLIGGGVHRSTMETLKQSRSFSKIPVMTTWNGADRLDARDANYLGRPNTWGQRAANLLLAQADLIIACGTRLGLQQTGFNWREFGKTAEVVQIDIDEAELTKGHPTVAQAYCCDVNKVLLTMDLDMLPGYPEWISYAREVGQLLPLNDPANSTAEGYVCPYTFFLQMSELSNPSDILIPCSSGGANSVAMQSIRQKQGQTVVTNKGLASMGYGLAGAIGASIAHPNRRVLLFEGDGGFAQNLQDLATVSVNRLSVQIFIFANNGYGSIRTTQRNYFGGAYLGCDTETGLGFPDWQKLFESYGIPCKVLTPDWENEVMNSGFGNVGPHAWILPIDPDQTYWPKITSRVTESGGMESRPLHEMSPDLEPDLLRRVSRFLGSAS